MVVRRSVLRQRVQVLGRLAEPSEPEQPEWFRAPWHWALERPAQVRWAWAVPVRERVAPEQARAVRAQVPGSKGW